MEGKYVVDVEGNEVSNQVPVEQYLQANGLMADHTMVAGFNLVSLSIWGALILFALFAVFGAIFVVRQQTVTIIERFGRFKKVARAGLNFKIPFVDKKAGDVDLRLQQLDVTVETKSKDNVFVNVKVSAQYLVSPEKADTAFYKLDDVKTQLSSYVFDTVRANVPKLDLDDVFLKKDEIATAVKSELTDVMDDFGFEILSTLVTDIDPDEKVKASMNEINAAQRLRDAANSRGEAEKILVVKAAEAESESKRLQGEGIAAQRKAIVNGLKESTEAMSSTIGVKPEEVMHLILLTQYFDTIKELGKDKVLFIDPTPAGMERMADQIKNAMLVAGEGVK